MHIHICTCMYTHTDFRSYIDITVVIYVCMYACTHLDMYVYMYAYMCRHLDSWIGR